VKKELPSLNEVLDDVVCHRVPLSDARKDLLRFLRIITSADPVLQVFPRTSHAFIDAYLRSSTILMDPRIPQTAPSLHLILDHISSFSQDVRTHINKLISEILHQAKNIVAMITTSAMEQSFTPINDGLRYKETGVYYGGPQIRHRPTYPQLDAATDTNLEDQNTCNKYYADIHKKSGGISVIWCQHGIAVGFHIIPKAEGRNDVFSAIYTRWATAPKLVVYDFACQLHTYCMRREPYFFADTHFAVDAFHFSKNHKKCSEAYNIRFFMEAATIYRGVKDTSAEVGNSGLAGIRKSISYMGQERAMSYIRIRLEVMNRMKIQRLRKNLW
jgi:Kyakuja-Dileera-Zisupton transposase